MWGSDIRDMAFSATKPLPDRCFGLPFCPPGLLPADANGLTTVDLLLPASVAWLTSVTCKYRSLNLRYLSKVGFGCTSKSP